MKKFLSLILAVVCFCAIFTFVGCNDEKDEKDNRQHVTLLVYDNKNSSEILCELSEENNRQTITVEYRAQGHWDFRIKIKYSDGNIKDMLEESAGRSFGKFISSEGEESYSWMVSKWKGTYEYFFDIDSSSTHAFPFRAKLIVEVI